MAKFDPFLSLDCARVEGVGAQSKERKGSNFAAQRSVAIVQKPEGPNTYDSKNPAIAIWQPCSHLVHCPGTRPKHEHGRVDGDPEGLQVTPKSPEVEGQGHDPRREQREQNCKHLHIECLATTTEISGRGKEGGGGGEAAAQQWEGEQGLYIRGYQGS